MSDARGKRTAPSIRAMKAAGEKIAALTAYDAMTARILDEAGVDVLLVGDSAAMVVLGYENTLPVTLDAMLVLTAAVARAKPRALVVGDMPFMSYQASVADAVRSAGRMVKEGGAEAVKLEGGRKIAPTVRAVLDAGIPVMGHIGLTPQSIHELGGYRVQGKGDDAHARLLDDAAALEEAGCFSIVLEAMPWRLAADITAAVAVPTIGIGAGPHCDGQVLVVNDIVGYVAGPTPKFVRRYGDAKSVVAEAARRFVGDVKGGDYPSLDESYS
ncbi:MAG: 3-methyl-2-oxobutanoate hydroxymethyltransferase [Candidatus Eisenbacteria bacterium]|nr:3-methyl-2-oxobutanoate hydroxymethyltransferase [Candidatus Eisenbacteria bacterium]